jgi:hypothetical protein
MHAYPFSVVNLIKRTLAVGRIATPKHDEVRSEQRIYVRQNGQFVDRQRLHVVDVPSWHVRNEAWRPCQKTIPEPLSCN